MPRVVHADRPGTIQFEGARAHFIGLMALEGAEQPVDGPRPRRGRSARSSPPASWSTAAAGVTRACRTPASSCTTRTTISACAPGQLGHRILSVPRAVCRHGKGTPGLSLRTGQGYSSRRVVLMIANRWRILLTRYELRTLLLLAPALLTFELTQFIGSIAKGWFPSWAAAVATIARDLPGIRRERRDWAASAVIGDGRVLEGGDLPFNPLLLRSRMEHVAARIAVGRGLAQLALVHRFLRDRGADTRP